MEDRIRAKNPPKNDNSWEKGTVVDYEKIQNKVKIQINSDSGIEYVEVSESIFELFKSRVEAEDICNSDCWYKIKRT